MFTSFAILCDDGGQVCVVRDVVGDIVWHCLTSLKTSLKIIWNHFTLFDNIDNIDNISTGVWPGDEVWTAYERMSGPLQVESRFVWLWVEFERIER